MPPQSGFATEIIARAMMFTLAMALDTRYNQLGNVQDLENSMLCWRHALRRLSPPGHPDRPAFLVNLARNLGIHYERFGNLKDLEEAISLLQEAFRLCPPGHPHRSAAVNSLGAALHNRYEKLGNSDDLKACISLQRDALSLCPSGHPDRFGLANNLATSLGAQYQKFGDPDNLEECISLLYEGLSLHPPGHPHRSMSLSNLATSLRIRYDRLGKFNDLEDSISLLYEGLSLRPPGHPHRSGSLNNLAIALGTRYKKLGNTDDLEACISLHRDALSLRPSGHPDRSGSLNNLATVLDTRYERLGNINDLEESISFHHEALSLRTTGHHERSTSLNNLASSLKIRYVRLGDTNDLERSILLHRDALSLRPLGHPLRPGVLNNLANALKSRFDRSGNANDLEDSMSLHRDAFSLFHPGNPDRFGSLFNLANDLSTRYEALGNSKDLQDCITLHHDALKLLPPGHPNRSMSLGQLSISLITRHMKLGETDDIPQAFDFFEQAASDPTSYLSDRLLAAIDWVKVARAYKHESIFSAYQTLLKLVNRSLIFRPNVEAQQRFLASANIPRSLASNAASAAIEAGKMELAVEFLEEGRGLLWSRVDAYKHPLHQLRQARGGDELADRLEAVSTQLEHLAFVSASATLNDSEEPLTKAAILENQMREYRVLSEEWNDLVGKVREIDGFSHFLRAAPFNDLRSAAGEGPVILVNISDHRSDAIILLNDRPPELVTLPEVLPPELRGQKCDSKTEITKTLAYLWDTIVSLIVDRLTELEVVKGSRIWWCLTAELCALPLHAAGRGKKNLHNLYVSSYTSTLTSLIRARSNIIQSPTLPRFLVVGQPSIDLQRVQDEVDIIKKIRPGADVLFGPDEANREAVLESLQDHSWVHFACHGLLGDKDQPFHTSFKLHEDIDRRLLLLDLIRARLPNAELAFLSACHSAAGGLSTPDESIHLSAALQFCGFKSVVGTLWEMDDEDGPTMAEKFYRFMFRNPDKIDFRDSAYALNSAIKEMRKAKIPLDRLVLFVHIGA